MRYSIDVKGKGKVTEDYSREYGEPVPTTGEARGEGWLVWWANMADRFDQCKHQHVDGGDGRPYTHRHAAGTDPHDHQPPVDLSEVPRTDIEREFRKRRDAEAVARQDFEARAAKLKREAEAAEQAELIGKLGITSEQFGEVEAYLYEKWEEDRG